MPVVYVDVLFLINMGIDSMLLLCSTKIAGIRTRWWRIVIAAAIGGIYAVCVFFPKLSALYLVAAKIAVSLIMVSIAFWVNSWTALLRAVMTFYLTGILFGGSIYGLIYFTGIGARWGTVVSNGSLYMNLPWKLLAVMTIVIFSALTILVRYLKKFLLYQGILGKLRITYDSKTVETDVLLDTGNGLKDPLSGKAVAVVELSRLRSVMPPPVFALLEQYRAELLYDVLPYAWATRLRLIPYSGVGVDNGILIGLVPDRVELKTQQQAFRECSCIIAVYPGKLKGSNGSGGMINPTLLV